MPEFTEEMESTFKGLVESHDKLTKQVAGQEDLMQRHKTEIGEARKEIKAAMEQVEGLDKEKLQKALDKLDTMEENTDSSSDSQERQRGSEEPSDVRKLMTEQQKQVADEQFKKLAPEDRIRIKGDSDEMKAFLNAAMESAPSVPDSLFDDDASPGEKPPVNKYRELFGLADKEASFVPGGARVDSGGFKGASLRKKSDQANDEKRLPNGIIPRPQPKE